MSHVVPPSLLFEYRFEIPHIEPPTADDAKSGLESSKLAALTFPSGLDGKQAFADVCLGWHESGLMLQVNVFGRQHPPRGSQKELRKSDAVRIWLDTRPSGSAHRATEYCHSFACLPVDQHLGGIPSAIVLPIAQQRHRKIESNAKKFLLRTNITGDGYQLHAWIPGEQLYGYRDVPELGRLGFFCVVDDQELGEQPLTITDDFPTSYNPSTWAQLELTQ